jgi:glycine/D-amino acid oxidase-like deaminating enzyme
MTTYDVAVVGLGIVGACAAHAIARTGARVVALDAGAPGAGTSGTSFAWINACHKEPEVYHRLNAAGMAAHRDLARELGAEGGHHEGGSLEWAERGDDEAALRELVARLASRGYAAELISRARALALEPGLAIPEHVREVAFFADEAWLDAPRLIRTALDRAAAKGAHVRWQTPVRSLRVAEGRVDALVTDAGDVTAASVVVCVGPATRAFLEPLGIAMPVDRVYGQLTITSRPAVPLTRVVHAPGVHLRPDAGGGLMLGVNDLNGPVIEAASASERAAFAAEMLARAARAFPAARDVHVVESRVGVRPMPSDDHTIAGRLPGLSNAWLIATHSGVTLGALLGGLIADEVVRGAPSAMLAPFRPDRFAGQAPGGKGGRERRPPMR